MARKNRGELLPPGYLPINRKLYSHTFWMEPRVFSKHEAWEDLLQSARWDEKPGDYLAGGMALIKFYRGEVVASIRYLGKNWRWSRSKVQRFLELLERENMISRRVFSGQTIIKLINYGLYNGPASNSTGDAVPKKHPKNEPPKEPPKEPPNNLPDNQLQELPGQQSGQNVGHDRDTTEDNTKEVIKKDKEEIQELPDFVNPKAPTLLKVQEVFLAQGGTEEQANSFFAKHDATGWYLNGSPIRKFSSLVGKYIHNWKKIENGMSPAQPDSNGYVKPKPIY